MADFKCGKHGWEWTDGDPGCPFCLRDQLEAVYTSLRRVVQRFNAHQRVMPDAELPQDLAFIGHVLDGQQESLEAALKSTVQDTAELERAKAQNNNLRGRLWNIVTAFKRGTLIDHAFCGCAKCHAIYEAIRAVQVYELPGQPSEIVPEKRSCVCAPEGTEFVTGCKTSTGGPCPAHGKEA